MQRKRMGQRRGGARPTRGGARRGPLARGRRHRLRTGLRTDHETDRTRRRRRDRRARRRVSMDRRPSPAVRVEHRAHDRRRPVGTALPGHPPSLRPRAQCRRAAWRTPSRRGVSGRSIRVRSGHLATRSAVVVASEPMDEDPGWRLLAPGELVHVDTDLAVHSRIAIDRPPTHLLTLDDLRPEAAASQDAQPR